MEYIPVLVCHIGHNILILHSFLHSGRFLLLFPLPALKVLLWSRNMHFLGYCFHISSPFQFGSCSKNWVGSSTKVEKMSAAKVGPFSSWQTLTPFSLQNASLPAVCYSSWTKPRETELLQLLLHQSWSLLNVHCSKASSGPPKLYHQPVWLQYTDPKNASQCNVCASTDWDRKKSAGFFWNYWNVLLCNVAAAAHIFRN